ncbi:MAG: Rpn family recombination-promoting nuclease/putative transposase [Treponema sp.]|nr:Rpn family recombination-promoting nuclease/putative transposase [Treponema sp.]
MTRLEYTFKTDTLFKMLFVQNPDLLKRLVCELLRIKFESIGQFEIKNPEMPPESLDGKFCRLDINMTVDGQLVDLEIQVRDEKDYPERALYYWAREYSTALPESGDYKDLPRTVIISIISFNQFDSPEFHSEFCPLEVNRHELLSDRMSLHFFELKKIPAQPLTANDKLLLWLALFKAETQEELEKIKALEEPVMEQAINAYQKITATPEFREMERMRSYARHNEAAALRHARDEGREEGMEKVAKNALKEGASVEFVQKITGLDMETIQRLAQ